MTPIISLRVATFRGVPHTIQSNAKLILHAIIPSNHSQFVFQHVITFDAIQRDLLITPSSNKYD